MMSMPLEGQPTVIQHQAYSPRSSSGSIGPVIAVLAVIAVLGVVAAVIGRLCSGRRFIGDRRFDFEGWVERKCASCIDGRIDNSGTGGGGGSSGGGPATATVEATPESKPPSASDPQNSASSRFVGNEEFRSCPLSSCGLTNLPLSSAVKKLSSS